MLDLILALLFLAGTIVFGLLTMFGNAMGRADAPYERGVPYSWTFIPFAISLLFFAAWYWRW